MAKNNNQKQVDELKTWDKLEYLQKKLDSRSKEFFINTSTIYTKISFAMIFICFVCLGMQFYKLNQITHEKGYYISGIDGRIYNIQINEEKYGKIVNALNQYQKNREEANRVKQSNQNIVNQNSQNSEKSKDAINESNQVQK